VVAADDAEAEGALVELVVDPLDELLAASVAAAARSFGIINGAPVLRLTVPLVVIMSGLLPMTARVYRTFDTIYSCDHSGIWVISMSEPQLAAAELFAHCVLVYDDIAAKVELFDTISDIIPATELFAFVVEGGLIMPNMPFSQCVAVPQ